MDTESISVLKNGNYVVGDEYYPSISIVRRTDGEILKILVPGDGLPKILQHKNFNKGFEALTVAANGKIYGLLEGVIDLDKTSRENSKIIRMIEIDLETGNTRMFAYGFDYSNFKKSDDVKIGDIAAIDSENFILVEQGKNKNGKNTNLIYKIGIKDATDISNIKLSDNRELEHGNLSELKHISFVSKELILNPREYNWREDKLEGLAIVNEYTIAITNDNDFAIRGIEYDKTSPNIKIKPILDHSSQKTNLWLIKFSKKLF